MRTPLRETSLVYNQRFAKIAGDNFSLAEALTSLKWHPFHGRRFGHRCVFVQSAIKGDVPEHFDIFRTLLRRSHNYNTRNGFLPRLPKPRREWGRCSTYFTALNDWAFRSNELKRPLPNAFFKSLLRSHHYAFSQCGMASTNP